MPRATFVHMKAPDTGARGANPRPVDQQLTLLTTASTAQQTWAVGDSSTNKRVSKITSTTII